MDLLDGLGENIWDLAKDFDVKSHIVFDYDNDILTVFLRKFNFEVTINFSISVILQMRDPIEYLKWYVEEGCNRLQEYKY